MKYYMSCICFINCAIIISITKNIVSPFFSIILCILEIKKKNIYAFSISVYFIIIPKKNENLSPAQSSLSSSKINGFPFPPSESSILGSSSSNFCTVHCSNGLKSTGWGEILLDLQLEEFISEFPSRMSSLDNELEEQLINAGNKLLDPPSDLDELLPLLDVRTFFFLLVALSYVAVRNFSRR